MIPATLLLLKTRVSLQQNRTYNWIR